MKMKKRHLKKYLTLVSENELVHLHLSVLGDYFKLAIDREIMRRSGRPKSAPRTFMVIAVPNGKGGFTYEICHNK